MIPGGGWQITYRSGDTYATEPVIGWTADDQGYGTAVITDSGGELIPVSDLGCDWLIWHPEQTLDADDVPDLVKQAIDDNTRSRAARESTR